MPTLKIDKKWPIRLCMAYTDCSTARHEALKQDEIALRRETAHQAFWLGMEMRRCLRCDSSITVPVVDPFGDTAEDLPAVDDVTRR
jgi:hypothetical protein